MAGVCMALPGESAGRRMGTVFEIFEYLKKSEIIFFFSSEKMALKVFKHWQMSSCEGG
jgi:hypothetical protein